MNERYSELNDALEKVYGKVPLFNNEIDKPILHGTIPIQWQLFSDNVLRLYTYNSEPGLIFISFEKVSSTGNVPSYNVFFPINKHNTEIFIDALTDCLNFVPKRIQRVPSFRTRIKNWWKSIWTSAVIISESDKVIERETKYESIMKGNEIIVCKVRSKENRNVEWISLDIPLDPRPIATLELNDTRKLVELLKTLLHIDTSVIKD